MASSLEKTKLKSVRSIRNLLWIDCSAGALAGVLVLVFAGPLSRLHAMPLDLLMFIGVVNLVYASYSFFLATRDKRPRPLITVLVVANGIWALACLSMAVAFADTATHFGLGHLVAEAIFVGGLAGLEWKWRAQLLRRQTH